MSKKKYPIDPMSYDVAAHFLSDIKGATDMDRTELAESVQKLCEEFAGGLAADEAGEENI